MSTETAEHFEIVASKRRTSGSGDIDIITLSFLTLKINLYDKNTINKIKC